MTGALYIVKFLENIGVSYIFGVPGDIQVDFYKELKESSITFITMKNEKSAAFAADIYSRVSGKVGVCFSTVAPGATNLVTGLANATTDRSSVVAISDLGNTDIKKHQAIDYDCLFNKKSGIVKENYIVDYTLYAILKSAFEKAIAEPKGAVHIGIPYTLMGTEVHEDFTATLNKPSYTLASSAFIGNLYNMLIKYKGAVIVGGDVKNQKVTKEFREFIEHYKLPVITTFRGKGTIDEHTNLSIGVLSRNLQHIYKEFIEDLDFVIVIGYDDNEGINMSTLGLCADTLSLNTVGNDFQYDLKDLFTQLNSKIKLGTDVILTKIKAKVDLDLYKGYSSTWGNYPLDSRTIMDFISQLYKDNSVIVCDVGLNKYFSGLYLKLGGTSDILFSNGISSMAFSSGAIGAKLARPDKDVLVIVGDGGFLMNPQEVSTCVQYNLPLTIVILNNGSLGLVKKKELEDTGVSYATDFSKVDYVKLAESFGANGYNITGVKALYRILSACRNNGKVNIINCEVDYEL